MARIVESALKWKVKNLTPRIWAKLENLCGVSGPAPHGGIVVFVDNLPAAWCVFGAKPSFFVAEPFAEGPLRRVLITAALARGARRSVPFKGVRLRLPKPEENF
ncbi:MAG: hypothetical protein ACXVCK_12765 [Bdellovibrionota bacterium]